MHDTGHRFLHDITRNRAVAQILQRWSCLNLPDCWLVAGCLFQTVWNLQTGKSAQTGIKDYDIFYFDADDLTQAGERRAQASVDALFADLGVTLEVANQARVHLWYPGYFGHPYPPLVSSEDGIQRFLVRETCVAARPGQWHAPFGLEGVYAGTLTSNPLAPGPEQFAAKAASYRSRWPHLVYAGEVQGNTERTE